MLVRNGGVLMTNPSHFWYRRTGWRRRRPDGRDGHNIARDARSEEKGRNAQFGRGLVYVVKPRWHGPQEVALRMRYYPGRDRAGAAGQYRQTRHHG